MKKPDNKSQKPRIDYDGQWKTIIMIFFKEFMQFFLPELLPDIDFSRPPEFLEQELAKIIPEKTAKGRRSIDKLVKVWLKNGEEKWLFIHIEVQSWDDPDFMERMFTYFYRIYDSKGKVIFAFAIFTDEVPEPHDRFEYKFKSTELVYKFKTYLVRDAKEEDLLKSDNVFALVVLASKYVSQTKNDAERRRKFKLKLFRLAIERGYSAEKIEALIIFLDIIMYLPPEMEQQFKYKFKEEVLKTSDMEKDYIISPTLDYVYGLNKEEIDKQIASINQELEEERKKVIEADKKIIEADKKVSEERKKVNEATKKLLLSGFFDTDEIADIMGMPVEEVETIKTEMDIQK